MSEADLNEFINRDYEAKDFYNLVSTVDSKIKSGDKTISRNALRQISSTRLIILLYILYLLSNHR